MFGRKRRAAQEAAAKAKASEALRGALVELIGVAEGRAIEPEGWPLVLKPGERLVYPIGNAGLFEPRREPGHWSGRSAGFSVPVADGIRFRVGKSAGTYVQGQEEPTVIDSGEVSFTSQRVVFQGGKYTREWLFSKLIGITHDASQPCTAIQVSNREKTSGIVYRGVSPDEVRLGLDVAVAIFNGEGPEVAAELRDKLNALDAGVPAAAPTAALPPAMASAAQSPEPSPEEARPASGASSPEEPPVASEKPSAPQGPPPMPPPMWAKDPTGRHQLRYWDGSAWTDYVSDDGNEYHESSPATGPG
jgi:Protein of unknown function (DUF2510)